MLKDAKRKYAQYEAERQKYGCKTPEIKDRTADASSVASSAAASTGVVAATAKESVTATMPTSTRVADPAQSTVVVPVREYSSKVKQEEVVQAVEPKEPGVVTARQIQSTEAAVSSATTQRDVQESVSDAPVYDSEKCNSIDEELIELAEFTSMVKNTSAFHLEEKASALPSPGFTVSNNKKKMLRDIEKRHAELLAKRQKYGCKPL